MATDIHESKVHYDSIISRFKIFLQQSAGFKPNTLFLSLNTMTYSPSDPKALQNPYTKRNGLHKCMCISISVNLLLYLYLHLYVFFLYIYIQLSSHISTLHCLLYKEGNRCWKYLGNSNIIQELEMSHLRGSDYGTYLKG